MTTNLRDTIAQAITQDNFGLTTPRTAQRQADRIIEALDITEETDYGTTYPNSPVTDVKYVRYVTKWMPAEGA